MLMKKIVAFVFLLCNLCFVFAQNIVFEETTHDFGLVATDSLHHTFRFTNKGGDVLIQISDVPCGSCLGCVKVKTSNTLIKKGEESVLDVSFKGFPRNAKPFTKSFTVTFVEVDEKEIKPQTTRIVIKGTTDSLTLQQTVLLTDPSSNSFAPVDKVVEVLNLDEISYKIGYPTFAREAGIEGKVILRILVKENGEYIRHEVMRQSHPILTQAVENEVCKLKTTLPIRYEKPIKYWTNIPFVFKLN